MGLRERKKHRTRRSIQREAMRLFRERGYDATTIQQIAEAADISQSTFFHYFPTKEDVVFGDEYDGLFAKIFAARPGGETLRVELLETLGELGAHAERDRDVVLDRARLILGVPALRARIWEDLERSQDLLRHLIAGRAGRDPDDLEIRVTAAILVSALLEAGREWVRSEGRQDLLELYGKVLDVVEEGARLEAAGEPV
jgi:AcrR family transcriptional regulator